MRERVNSHPVDLQRHRLHDEIGEEQRQTHQRLVARRVLRAQRLPQKMKDDQNSHKRRHRKQQGGQNSQQRQNDDNRPSSRCRMPQANEAVWAKCFARAAPRTDALR